MKPVSPDVGVEEIVYASGQPQYQPVAVTRHNAEGYRRRYLLTRWQPTPEERQAIANGEDIYVAQLNFMRINQEFAPMTPIIVQVGPGWFATEDARK